MKKNYSLFALSMLGLSLVACNKNQVAPSSPAPTAKIEAPKAAVTPAKTTVSPTPPTVVEESPLAVEDKDTKTLIEDNEVLVKADRISLTKLQSELANARKDRNG